LCIRKVPGSRCKAANIVVLPKLRNLFSQFFDSFPHVEKFALNPIVQREALVGEVNRQGCDDLGVHGAAAPCGHLGKVLPHPFGQPNDKLVGAASSDNRMEREPEDEADDSELEPSLGSFDRVVDQSKAWRQRGEFCSGNDAEQDDADAEPSLGSLGNHHPDQERWAAGGGRDLELTTAKPVSPIRTDWTNRSVPRLARRGDGLSA
jgi:hypothetical protein